jgi:hypothetical protein
MPLGGVPPGGGGTGDEEETTTSTGGGGTQARLEQLQNLAISHATTLGLLTDQYMDLIMSLPYDDLVQLVDDLQQMVNASGLALGGGVTPGYAWVGEQGPELVRFNQAARIDPAALFRNAPTAVCGGGSTTIDRSINMGGLSFPDPRGIPPTYIAAMENIAANVVKKSWRG